MSNHLLIVDDQPGIRSLLKEIFNNPSFTLCICENGYDAVKRIETFEPEVAILDMKMPGMDGIEVAQRLRAKYPTVIIILMTAYSESEIKERADAVGVNKMFSKPFNILDLRNYVMEIFEKKEVIL